MTLIDLFFTNVIRLTTRRKVSLQSFVRAGIFLSFCGLGSGCLFPSREYRPVSHFDLTIEADLNTEGNNRQLPVSLAIGQFQSLGPYGKRMVYRKADHRLELDEYNRWIQPPAELARKALYQEFLQAHAFDAVALGTTAQSDFILTVDLLSWETSPDLKAVITAVIRLKTARTGKIILNRTYKQAERLKAGTPAQFAASASTCMSRVITEAFSDSLRAISDHAETRREDQ